jgi:signal transduction histidine kinase
LRDSGVGIECNRLLNVFQSQGQRSTFGTEKEKGTGLGLVLVKEFTELNEGTINIQSEPGSGTLITLLLPAGKN